MPDPIMPWPVLLLLMDPLVSPCNSIIISLNDICSDDKTEPFPGFIVTLYTELLGSTANISYTRSYPSGWMSAAMVVELLPMEFSAVVIASLISI